MKDYVKFLNSIKTIAKLTIHEEDKLFQYDYHRDSSEQVKISLYPSEIDFLIKTDRRSSDLIEIFVNDETIDFVFHQDHKMMESYIENVDVFQEEDMSYLILQSDFHNVLNNDSLKQHLPNMQEIMDFIISKF